MPRRTALRLVKPTSQPTPPKIEVVIFEFLLAKQQERRSHRTVELYKLRLEQFNAWLTERNVLRLSDLSRLILREWGALLNPEWQPATVRQCITIVRGFLRWCASEGLVDDRLAGALRLPRVRSRVQRTLSADEVKRLLDACNTSMFGLRDSAIVSLMVDSGLRASEVCRIKIDDLIFDFSMVDRRVNFILTIGKNGNEEPVYFGQSTAVRLHSWLNVRVAKPGVKSLFVSLGGITPLRSLTSRGLYAALKELGRRAGIPGVTPHSLRRAFALLLVEAGHTTRQVQALGRWSDIRMVERYTQALKTARLYQSPVDRLKTNRPKSG